jgi:hypothetical protein
MADLMGVICGGLIGATALFGTCMAVSEEMIGSMAAIFGLLTMFGFILCGMSLVEEE